MSNRPRPPVVVARAGEQRPVAVVPSSVVQATQLAEDHAAEGPPGPVLFIKRGEKVLGKVESRGTDAA